MKDIYSMKKNTDSPSKCIETMWYFIQLIRCLVKDINIMALTIYTTQYAKKR